jgi:hypothetical protein
MLKRMRVKWNERKEDEDEEGKKLSIRSIYRIEIQIQIQKDLPCIRSRTALLNLV